jgi:hypothetical protein
MPSFFQRGMSAAAIAAVAFFFSVHFSNAQQADAVRRWDFNAPRELASSANIAGAEIKDGMLVGKTEYDPYFYLTVPEGGLDANRYAKMRVRMFSSAPADAIAIYYKDEGNNWALGTGPKILEGWNVYEFDLNTQVSWKGDAGSDEARVWGGPNKSVKIFRLDPGNQADRDLKIDWIELVGNGSTPALAPQAGSTPKEQSAIETLLPPDATWNWKIEGDLRGWKGGNIENLEARGGVLRGLTKYDSMLLVPQPLKFDARDYQIVEFKIKSDVSGGGEIYFARQGESFSDQRVVQTSIVGDNKWHVYRYNMAGSGNWSGQIEGLRFDPLNPAGASIEIEYLRLLPPEDGNMIANGGFEIADINDTKRAENWSVVQGRAELAPRAGKGNALVFSGDAVDSVIISTGVFENLSVGRHQLSLDYQSDAATTAHLKIQFQNIYGEKLSSLALDIPLRANANWQSAQHAIVIPERAGRMSLALEIKSAQNVRLDNIALKNLETPDMLSEPIPGGQPVWQATWLAAPDAMGQDAAPRHFRKSFTIDDPAQVESARVLLTADNVSRLWINGQQLPAGPFADDWKIADVYDIAPFLQKGENVVGVQSWNEGSAEGMIAEIGIRFKSDKHLFLLSDASWKSKTGDVPANWSSAEFSAAAWNAPQLIAKFPGGPWGATVEYSYLGPSLVLRDVSYSFASSGALGETKQLTATFTPSQTPTRPVVLSLELGRKGERGVSFWTQQLDTKNWKVGEPVKIGPLPVELPRYSAPGDYQLRLRVPYATLLPAATFKPIAAGSTPGGSDALAQAFALQMKGEVKTPVAKIKYLNGSQIPFLEINGQPHTVMHMMHGNAEKKLIRLSRENNMDLIWLNIERGFGWQKGGPYDFSDLDRVCSELLNQYPDAYLVLNVPLDSVYNPGMRPWNTQNPDELVKDHTGSTRIGGYHGAVIEAPSYSSRVWMNDASDAWRALVKHIRSGPIGERVIGYVPISGISWEWFYWGAQSREFVDYSRPATQHFQNWAREKYGEIAKLNAAWKTAHADWSAISVPTKDERLHTDAGLFLDPQKSQKLIDFHEFFSDVIFNDVLEFCRVVKEETNGEALTGTYYGYNMQVISAYLAQHTGHMAQHKILQSPDIDFLMSPSRYQDRGIGGGAGFMMTTDSIKLHGKYYIAQADIRTVNASGPGGQLARLSTLAESAAVLEREFANSITNGVASQWYDFGQGWIGGDARLMEVVGKLQKLEADLQKVPRVTIDPARNIAVIVDEKSTFYTATESDIHANTVSAQIDNLHRTGVGFDTYVLDDLEKLGDYKAFLFLNTFRITPAQQKFINEKLKRDGKVLTWVFAPGVLDEKTLDFSRASKISGFEIGVQNEAASLRVAIKPGDNPVLRYIKNNASYGNPQKQSPILFARDGQSLGVIEGTENSGLAVKKFDDWSSIFSLAPNLSPTLLRGIAVFAGLPVYNEFDGDVTYVGDRLFAVHTYGGGARTFTVPVKNGVAKELLHGKEAKIENGKFHFELPEKSTSLFLLPPTS